MTQQPDGQQRPATDADHTVPEGAEPDPNIDGTVRPPLVAGALAHRGLVEPEGVNAENEDDAAPDVRGGGRPQDAPRNDRDRWKTDDELVGAGPQTHTQLNRIDDVEDSTEG